jgi:hypothetical protein
VARGYVTVEDAERHYGVVLRGDPPAVDGPATAARRQRGSSQGEVPHQSA